MPDLDSLLTLQFLTVSPGAILKRANISSEEADAVMASLGVLQQALSGLGDSLGSVGNTSFSIGGMHAR